MPPRPMHPRLRREKKKKPKSPRGGIRAICSCKFCRADYDFQFHRLEMGAAALRVLKQNQEVASEKERVGGIGRFRLPNKQTERVFYLSVPSVRELTPIGLERRACLLNLHMPKLGSSPDVSTTVEAPTMGVLGHYVLLKLRSLKQCHSCSFVSSVPVGSDTPGGVGYVHSICRRDGIAVFRDIMYSGVVDQLSSSPADTGRF